MFPHRARCFAVTRSACSAASLVLPHTRLSRPSPYAAATVAPPVEELQHETAAPAWPHPSHNEKRPLWVVLANLEHSHWWGGVARMQFRKPRFGPLRSADLLALEIIYTRRIVISLSASVSPATFATAPPTCPSLSGHSSLDISRRPLHLLEVLIHSRNNENLRMIEMLFLIVLLYSMTNTADVPSVDS